jgi:hypothetical protein
MGPDTLAIPYRLFAKNRARLAERLRALPGCPPNAVVVLQGGKDETHNDTGPFPSSRFFDGVVSTRRATPWPHSRRAMAGLHKVLTKIGATLVGDGPNVQTLIGNDFDRSNG